MLKKLAFHIKLILLSFLVVVSFSNNLFASDSNITYSEIDSIKYVEFKGKVIDGRTKKVLVYATLSVNNSNISTITNNEGSFVLKVPTEFIKNDVIISFLGYKKLFLNLQFFKKENTVITLEPTIEELSEVTIYSKDPNELIKEVLKKRSQNYFDKPMLMTSFYRETIKKRRTYASLSEAVVEVHKQPYTSSKTDIIKLFKSRKKTNYNKLDTIALKLRGGPFSNLYLDFMKTPRSLFTDDMFNNYTFSYDASTKISNKVIYVVNFKQKSNVTEPLYYGKLYIDAESLAIKSATFNLNLEDQAKASRIFVHKKPRNVSVIPTEASYYIDYREENGKWYYGYSKIELSFKVKWAKKLFSSTYNTTIEMATTDWKINPETNKILSKDRMRPSVIMSEEASGFSDPDFWGAYNLIEPEKSIESAINKIKRQLKRVNN